MLADFPREIVTDLVENLDYQQRKERGICTRPGCPHPACEDSLLCKKHRMLAARALRRHRRRRRKAREIAEKRWAAQRRCLGCGEKRLKGHEHCAKCLVRFDRVEKLVGNHERNPKADRIASNTSIDADGRSRYRGQGKRGRQSVAQLDDQDFRFALDALQKARDGIAFIAQKAAGLSKNERKAAIDAALAHALHSSRLVEDVLDRHGFFGKVDPDAKGKER